MVATTNSQPVASGGWAAALSSRGLGQNILLGIMALSVLSGALAAPSPAGEMTQGRSVAAGKRNEDGLGAAMVRSEAKAARVGIAGTQGERAESFAESSGEHLEARGHKHEGAAPKARWHHRQQRAWARAVVTKTVTSQASASTHTAEDASAKNKSAASRGKGHSLHQDYDAIPSRSTSTKASTRVSSTSAPAVIWTYGTSRTTLEEATAFSTSHSEQATSLSSASSTAAASFLSSSSTTESPLPTAQSLNSNTLTVNKVAAAASSTLSVFNVHSKLFPAVVVIIVFGVLALSWLLFLGIRGYRWKQQEKAEEEARRAQLSATGRHLGSENHHQRSRSSRIKTGAQTLRKALSSEKLGGDSLAPASAGSVLLEVGDEVVCVPVEVAEEYQAAKRIYGNSPDMWNGKLYLSQCMARHKRNERLWGGAPHTPSPLSNLAAWNRSNSTLVSDGYLDEEKRSEEKHGLSTRLLENLRAMRAAKADETDDSIDPEKLGALNDFNPVVTQGSRYQWGITPSRSSSQQEDVEAPARRSSELPYAPFTPQMMPSPITFDNFDSAPLPRQMSVLVRQSVHERAESVSSPRMIPLPASPMPEALSLPEEGEAMETLTSLRDLPKVSLEDTPSPEARTRIVSRRYRHRTSAVPPMPASSADAYGYPSQNVAMPSTSPRGRAASYAVASQPAPAGRQRDHRAASVPVHQYPVTSPRAMPIAPSAPAAPTAPPSAPAGPQVIEQERPRAVSSRMSPVSSRDRLQQVRANLQQERQRGVSYSGGPAAARTTERGNRYVSGPAAAPPRKPAPVWTRQQSLE
ncbi:hypothetical protein BCV69DRAFT_194832 [Microstroma glucosiphilum]|uniref:Uncharacterized protein n=1 Tax=Pseudomicrostroma glucosiphilum TaxID=1684307 RepID=A0A316U611_9BASI|nr:hypothetical protein BCV69DRAFT_194832 [Pseudomicrostroma glucosiphilum]PWN20640.1 hypothetical protein BCV69DRAFT_194832 [Pseudomicrostroma glucosiphilum]